MNEDNYSAQIIGVFLAETVKNAAKGSANLIYTHFKLLLYSEITELGLTDYVDAEEVTKQLEAKPETLEQVRKKLNAHPHLAEEMHKTIEASKSFNRDIFSSNVTSHNQSGGQTAHTIINNSALPVLPVRKIKIDIDYQLQQATDGLETYILLLNLTNIGDKPISNYRFEIEFPRAFLNDSTIIAFEKEGQRTEKYRFFRVLSEHSNNKVLYPDDSRTIFSPNYFFDGRVSYDDILRIKVYIDEELIRNIEKPMTELIDD